LSRTLVAHVHLLELIRHRIDRLLALRELRTRTRTHASLLTRISRWWLDSRLLERPVHSSRSEVLHRTTTARLLLLLLSALLVREPSLHRSLAPRLLRLVVAAVQLLLDLSGRVVSPACSRCRGGRRCGGRSRSGWGGDGGLGIGRAVTRRGRELPLGLTRGLVYKRSARAKSAEQEQQQHSPT
jgi:hypothetical protein